MSNTGSSKFQCPVCGKGFSKVNRLKQHFKMFHDGDTCPICNTRHSIIANHFRQVNDPKHHLYYFLKVRRFRCNPTIRLEALRILTDAHMEGVMRGGSPSTLKPRKASPSKAGQVARPKAAMRDVPLERAATQCKEVQRIFRASFSKC